MQLSKSSVMGLAGVVLAWCTAGCGEDSSSSGRSSQESTASEPEAESSHESCDDNDDEACPAGTFCDRDTCRVPFVSGNIGNECVIGSGRPPCSSGFLCVEGLCRSCIDDEECSFGQACVSQEGYEGQFCGSAEAPSPPATPPVGTDTPDQ